MELFTAFTGRKRVQKRSLWFFVKGLALFYELNDAVCVVSCVLRSVVLHAGLRNIKL